MPNWLAGTWNCIAFSETKVWPADGAMSFIRPSRAINTTISSAPVTTAARRASFSHTKPRIRWWFIPRGCLPEAKYIVGFDSTQDTTERTGADLMANGIAIEDQQPGELIYLNLPNRPGSGQDKIAPQSPSRVLARREVNIGHSGVGIYWSPGADDNWISYYEVRRDGQFSTKSASATTTSTMPGLGWLSRVCRANLDGDGNASVWTVAEPMAGEPMTFAALGGHFSQPGRDGWSAETTADERNFTPMTWCRRPEIPPPISAARPTNLAGSKATGKAPGGARRARLAAGLADRGLCPHLDRPLCGTVRIVGRAMREYYHRSQGGTLGVKILHGQQQIWPEKDWAAVAVGDLTGVAHDITDVAAGDVVRFVLDKGRPPKTT